MTDAPLFGLLILDRDPYLLSDFWGLFQAWLQDAGGFAAVGLALYLIYALRTPAAQAESARHRAGVTGWMLLMAVLALAAYVAFVLLAFVLNRGADTVNVPPPAGGSVGFVKYEPPKWSWDLQPMALTLGGLFGLLGIGQPFAAALSRVRFGRVYAFAKLAFKEIIRNRIVWVLVAISALPQLFPVGWFFPTKAEDELRVTVAVMIGVTQVLLLLTFALVASFGIHNDIKNQNIYTIVSKPVERFEVVFGRFLGYVGFMTLALFVMTLVGWGVIQTVKLDPKAEAETYRARVPVRGELSFASRRAGFEGTNVGREFDYRKYIGGDPASPQRAVWSFDRLPSGLTAAGRDHVPLEFTFDIFRMTKGEENRGVDVSVRVVTHNAPQVPPTAPNDGRWKWADPAKEQAYLADARQMIAALPGATPQQADNPASFLALAKPGDPAWDVVNKLAEKYGFYEVEGKEIFDYHPEAIAVPVGLFRNAEQGAPKAAGPDEPTPPRVQAYVKCETRSQMLGMAEPDLYFLSGERTFGENYFKAAVGVWCRVVLVIGLAIVCSTYLAGVINFLVAGFLFLAGYATEHLVDMASGQSAVGGPFRAMNQLLKAEQPTAQLDEANPLTRAAEGGDVAFAWVVRRFVNVVPDVYAYSWTDFVKEGFNIPAEALAMNFVLTVGYLLPWFILGYFLFRSREVAA